MKRSAYFLKERVYDLMNGNLDLEAYPVPECAVVRNEFEDGSLCSDAYEAVFAAYSRLCARLQVENGEDPDIECIVQNLMFIGKHLSLKMFEYGAILSAKKDPPPSSAES